MQPHPSGVHYQQHLLPATSQPFLLREACHGFLSPSCLPPVSDYVVYVLSSDCGRSYGTAHARCALQHFMHNDSQHCRRGCAHMGPRPGGTIRTTPRPTARDFARVLKFLDASCPKGHSPRRRKLTRQDRPPPKHRCHLGTLPQHGANRR